MWILIIRIALGLWRKLVPLFLAMTVVIAGAALFLYARDHVGLELDRERQLEVLAETEKKLEVLREEASARAEELRAEAEVVQQRYRRAERLLNNLQAMQGFWENLFRTRAEKERERERLAWAEKTRNEIGWSYQDLALQLEAAETNLLNVEERYSALQREREELKEDKSEVLSYTRQAWLAVRGPVIVGVVTFIAGPTVWKLFCFYAWAPLIGLGKPIRLRADSVGELPEAASQVSKRVLVNPGERAVLKEKFLQASDEALKRRTRFVFDWRIPFSSAACGLIELIEMVNEGDREQAVTFSTQEEPMTELSVIELPYGAALVLRPSHLAGVVGRVGERLRIDRHWRVFSVHAWVTFQFRYFEFHGPCRLIVAGQRGVRMEVMRAAPGAGAHARRTNQDATIGFTPDLRYHSVRAETFWSYYRGRNPLFDDLFRGSSGVFICQEISTRAGTFSLRRFWGNFWGGLLKVFGL